MSLLTNLASWRPFLRRVDAPPPKKSRLRWLFGASLPWALVWLLLALRVALRIKERPHPFLPQIEFSKPVLDAAASWALTALAVYLGVGLVLALVAKLSTSNRHGSDLAEHMTISDGLRTGFGTVLFFHGVLYTMVPMGMVGLPGLKHLPMILALALFLFSGGGLLWRVIKKEASRYRLVRWAALLFFMAAVPQVPHDIIRKSMPLPPPLPPDVPRVLIIGIDGARKDLVEEFQPSWKSPSGVNSVCVAPATRRSWSLLLGKDPDKLKNSIIMPFRSDIGHPEEFKLLALAREKGLRTAWAIDDSLTAGYGNAPHLFTTVRESPGGWKYWFTLGLGTVFPVYSWAQNYAAPIENTNPWADIGAYYRDLERLTETHHWVFSHTCTLHEPIRMSIQEMQEFRPWRWLLDSVWSYRPYEEPEQAIRDPSRLDMRSSALGHYSTRLKRITGRLEPMLMRWEKKFPRLSGLVTADHGEIHRPVEDKAHAPVTHLEGYHGFTLEPFTMWVPMHPFGKTKYRFESTQSFTWIELRDSLANLARYGGDLELNGRDGPLFIQFPTIRARHLETSEEKELDEDLGIDPKSLLNLLYIYSNGMWWAEDPPKGFFDNRKLSSGLLKGENLLLFNPVKGGKYERLFYEKYKLISRQEVLPKDFEREIEPFRLHLAQPMTFEGRPARSADAQRQNIKPKNH